jgi:hypothetical protein
MGLHGLNVIYLLTVHCHRPLENHCQPCFTPLEHSGHEGRVLLGRDSVLSRRSDPEDGGSMLLQDIVIHLEDCMVSQPVILTVTAVKTSNFLTVFSICTLCIHRSQNSSVGIVTGYGLDGPGSIPSSERFFSSPDHPDQLGYRGLFPRGLSGSVPVGIVAACEVDHSPLSRAKVKKGGAIPPLPHMS